MMGNSSPVVLLIEPADAADDVAALLVEAGFRVQTSSDDHISAADVLALAPALVAFESQSGRSTDALDLARRLRSNPGTRAIPLVVYAPELRGEDIDHAAQTGILWLQIGPADALKLVAAIRGVVGTVDTAPT
jgi:hypothetical protein